MNANLEQELAKLSQSEKLEVLVKLWDQLDADALAPPMSDELFAELERRARWADAHPEELLTIDQIAQELGVRL